MRNRLGGAADPHWTAAPPAEHLTRTHESKQRWTKTDHEHIRAEEKDQGATSSGQRCIVSARQPDDSAARPTVRLRRCCSSEAAAAADSCCAGFGFDVCSASLAATRSPRLRSRQTDGASSEPWMVSHSHSRHSLCRGMFKLQRDSASDEQASSSHSKQARAEADATSFGGVHPRGCSWLTLCALLVRSLTLPLLETTSPTSTNTEAASLRSLLPLPLLLLLQRPPSPLRRRLSKSLARPLLELLLPAPQSPPLQQ